MADSTRPEDQALQQLRQQVETESNDGLDLLRNPADNAVCSVFVDNAVPCVCVVWKGYATSSQMRFIHECMLDLLKQHSLHKLLGDDTALPTVPAEDQAWIAQDWMPRAVAAGLRAGASKVSSAYFGRLSTEGIRAMAPEGLTIRFFDDMQGARQWLRGMP